jgi:hypothetical protein
VSIAFLSKREYLVVNMLLSFKPVERFKYRSDMREFRSVGDSTCSRIYRTN